MPYVRANLFYERESWKRPLTWSVVFHGLLVASIVITGYLYSHRPVNQWGMNNGEAVTATLVSAAPIPIAPHTEESNNIVANDSKGVTETRPQPKPVETEDGVSIPEKIKQPKKIAKTVVPPNAKPPRPVPTPEDTAVPYGDKGPVSGPFGAFTAPNTQGGFSFQNSDFGSRFAYYVRQVNQIVSRNWYKPDVAAPRRAYIEFDIPRGGGSASNVRIEQSSGVPALDQMAMRAVQRSDFPALPAEYNGSKVSVEFWFDYQR